MSSSLNQVTLIGRLTRDPELTYTPTGTPVCKFGIAVDRWQKDDQGNHLTDFLNVTAWKQKAEFVGQYIGKGRLVCITGRIETRSWEKEGVKHYATDIIAADVLPLDRKPENGEQAEGEGAPAAAPAATRTKRPAPVADESEDADPFADE